MIKTVRSLIIATEDSEVISQLSKIFLAEDYTIIIEKSQTKTILKALEHQVDLLVLDLAQPDTSKMDLVNIIRKTRPRLPIIVLSEDNSIEVLRELAEAGVFYSALKPVNQEEINEVIQAVTRIEHKNGEINSLIFEKIDEIKKRS
ncbi:response regulator [candidate division KSB1 bacterium]|nr:response regulator [candidate division KSB1 bacterium]